MQIKDILKLHLISNRDLNSSFLRHIYAEKKYLMNLLTRKVFQFENITLFRQYQKYAKQRIKMIDVQLKRRHILEKSFYKKFDEKVT